MTTGLGLQVAFDTVGGHVTHHRGQHELSECGK